MLTSGLYTQETIMRKLAVSLMIAAVLAPTLVAAQSTDYNYNTVSTNTNTNTNTNESTSTSTSTNTNVNTNVNSYNHLRSWMHTHRYLNEYNNRKL